MSGQQASVPGALPVVAVLAAAAVPSLIMGRAAIAVAVILAVLVGLAAVPHALWWPALRAAALHPLSRLLALVFAAWLPSLFTSLDPLLSVQGWAWTLVFVVAAAFIWSVLSTRPSVMWLAMKALLVAGSLSFTVALFSLYGPPEILNLVRFQGWQPRDTAFALKGYASAAMLLIPALLWAGWRAGGPWRGVAVVAALAALAVIERTGARAAVAGFLAMAVFLGACLALQSRRRHARIAMALVVALALFSTFGFLVEHERVQVATDVEPYLPLWLVDLHRQIIWDFTLEQWRTSPWFGVGINAVDRSSGAFEEIRGLGGHYLPSHPHSWLLEILAETGIVGFVPTVMFVAASLIVLARDFLRTARPEALVAGTVSVGYWASGLFNFSFWSSWWQVAHLVLVALILSARSLPPRPRATTGAAGFS